MYTPGIYSSLCTTGDLNSPVADNIPDKSTEVLSGRIIFTLIGIPVSIFSKSPEITTMIGDDDTSSSDSTDTQLLVGHTVVDEESDLISPM